MSTRWKVLSRNLANDVKVIAGAYLEQYPEEGDRLDAPEPGPALTFETTRSHLRQSMLRDLEAGDLVGVGGWILPRSEARFYTTLARDLEKATDVD